MEKEFIEKKDNLQVELKNLLAKKNAIIQQITTFQQALSRTNLDIAAHNGAIEILNQLLKEQAEKLTKIKVEMENDLKEEKKQKEVDLKETKK